MAPTQTPEPALTSRYNTYSSFFYHLGRTTDQAPYSLWNTDADTPEFLSQEKYRPRHWRQDQQITIR